MEQSNEQFDEEPLVEFEKGSPKRTYPSGPRKLNFRKLTKQQKIIGILSLALAMSLLINVSLFGITLHYSLKSERNNTSHNTPSVIT